MKQKKTITKDTTQFKNQNMEREVTDERKEVGKHERGNQDKPCMDAVK